MLNSKILFSLAIGAACALSQTAFADETSSASTQVSTPAGSSSSSVEKHSDAAGSSTKVESANSNAAGSEHKVYKAAAGPNGAKVSATKSSTGLNADGSVSTSTKHESHTVNDLGSTHHKAVSNTVVGPDGSTSSEKHESTKTQAN